MKNIQTQYFRDSGSSILFSAQKMNFHDKTADFGVFFDEIFKKQAFLPFFGTMTFFLRNLRFAVTIVTKYIQSIKKEDVKNVTKSIFVTICYNLLQNLLQIVTTLKPYSCNEKLICNKCNRAQVVPQNSKINFSGNGKS